MSLIEPKSISTLALLAAFSVLSAPPAVGNEALGGGFFRAEAMQLLLLAADADGFGVDGVGLPDTSQWTRVGRGADASLAADSSGGFGPFDNQWILWRRNDVSETYAIVIRGTVYDKNSIKDDFLADTLYAERVAVPAGKNRSISFRLASTSYKSLEPGGSPVAEVHAGFAYALAALLFDRQYGLMKALSEIPNGSRVFITGHSQGAALATLLHSFLHYACADDYAKAGKSQEDQSDYVDCDRFGLIDKKWSMKSYVFAQPKPGNWRYAMDLAELAGNRGMFYTIDNYDDPVVQAPLALQDLPGSLTPQQIAALPSAPVLRAAVGLAHGVRRLISKRIDEKILDDRFKRNHGTGRYADRLDERYIDGGKKIASGVGGVSLNYTPAGNVISVRARAIDNPADKESTRKSDFLWEHHLWRYQELSRYWPDARP
jgi:hypothetical protein